MERKVNLRELKPAGSYPSVEEKAAMLRARAIHNAESDGVAVSWSAQERAQTFANEHELWEVLNEVLRLDPGGALSEVIDEVT